ncbi:MAG: type II secretion system protein GspG [Phycisphaerales bacterium]|nr:MAG: type II secretion system protein GspG [Phycisphaerales bacterium]
MRCVVTVVGAGLVLCIILSGCRESEEQRLNAERAKRTVTWSRLEDVKTAVLRFKLDTNRYPTEQGVRPLLSEDRATLRAGRRAAIWNTRKCRKTPGAMSSCTSALPTTAGRSR